MQKVTEIFMSDKVVKDIMENDGLIILGRVVAILENKKTGDKKIIHGLNVVTDDGDTYYAQSACAEAPDDDFDDAAAGLRLGDDNTTPTKSDTDVTVFLAGTDHVCDATYPRTADPDGDNSGAGVDIVTWRYSYTTAQGNAVDIIEGAIVDNDTTPTAALCHFLFAGIFTKTSSDTLKVFVNHTFTGV